MRQHTQGPWSCEYGTDGYYAVYQGDEPVIGDVGANERLIASAPDLFKALTELLGNAEHARMYMQHDQEESQIMASALYDTILQAREAVAKATGAA